MTQIRKQPHAKVHKRSKLHHAKADDRKPQADRLAKYRVPAKAHEKDGAGFNHPSVALNDRPAAQNGGSVVVPPVIKPGGPGSFLALNDSPASQNGGGVIRPPVIKPGGSGSLMG